MVGLPCDTRCGTLLRWATCVARAALDVTSVGKRLRLGTTATIVGGGNRTHPGVRFADGVQLYL